MQYILNTSDVEYIHSALMDLNSNNVDTIRSVPLLQSAVESAYQTFDGNDLYSSIEDKAAKLMQAIIKNHPFIDGNKCTGLCAMLTMLTINDIKINCTQDELVELAVDVANGLSILEIVNWIEKHKQFTNP